MGSINLYRIDKEKIQPFYQELSSKMQLIKTLECKRINQEEPVDFGCTLYISRPKGLRNIKWNWLLDVFDEKSIQVGSSPSAVLLVEKDENTVYVATFGHSYFLVDKFSDKEFGFTFARKILFDEIKTTTLTTPNSKRNKTVNTYINYNELEFDSGESFAKLKAKAHLPEDFSLFKPALEIGTSIRCSTEEDSLEQIVDIILFIENVIQTEHDRYKIPVFSRIKDAEQIRNLDNNLLETVQEHPGICISELDIIGATEVFNRNDNEFILKYKRKEKKVASLSDDDIKLFCDENEIDYRSTALSIKVSSLIDGEPVSSAPIHDLIDYTDDKTKCLLSKGVWYQYNDDYLSYLEDSIGEIKAEYHPEFDFSSSLHDSFIDSLMPSDISESIYCGKTKDQIRLELKKKYYAERAFNMLMEQKHGFKKYDRIVRRVGGANVELMDLYKDKTMYAVKIGNTSAKLCYAVDQSISSLRLYKHKLLESMPEIDTVALWFVLERKTHIEQEGIPKINQLELLMLKNRLDQWKKEVRLQGLTPLIYINYKSE